MKERKKYTFSSKTVFLGELTVMMSVVGPFFFLFFYLRLSYLHEIQLRYELGFFDYLSAKFIDDNFIVIYCPNWRGAGEDFLPYQNQDGYR